MNRQSQLHAFPIPDKYFPACKVVQPFYARVIYSVKDEQVIIEDVGFSEKCLLNMNGSPSLIQEIRADIEEALKKRSDFYNRNKHVPEIFIDAIASHI